MVGLVRGVRIQTVGENGAHVFLWQMGVTGNANA